MAASCASGLIWKWGDYEHPVGECYPAAVSIERHVSDQNVRWASTFRIKVAGSLTGDSASDLNTKMDAMIVAYSDDYKDCGFYWPDDGAGPDVATPHVMVTNNKWNLTGNRIIQRSWDSQYDTELVNTRSFSFIVEAMFVDFDRENLHASETVKQVGTGGEVWKMYNRFSAAPEKVTVQDNSRVTYTQQGKIVNLFNRPAVPAPYWPTYLHEEKTVITRYSPKGFGNLSLDLPGDHVSYIGYTLEYAYFFEAPGDQVF